MVECGVGPAAHPYHRFGSGDERLVVLTGVLDGIGWWNDPDWFTTRILAHYYFREYREYDVWVIARPPGLPADVGAAELAAGYVEVLAELGPAHVLGLSLGGAIGAHLATQTDLVERLVLVSCGAGLGQYGRQTIERWREYAAARRYQELHMEYIRTVYAGWRRLAVPPMYRAGLRWLPEPEASGDVARSCAAMLSFDASVLAEVSVPTLVVGGKQDVLVPVEHHREAARRLDGPLALVAGGHGVYEEGRTLVADAVLPFLDGALGRQ
jgi:pimeloyl-ACP methyl ester carboxylesterase